MRDHRSGASRGESATTVSFGKDSHRRVRWSLAEDEKTRDVEETAGASSTLESAARRLEEAQAQRDAARHGVESARGEAARLLDELARARRERSAAGAELSLGAEQDVGTISVDMPSSSGSAASSSPTRRRPHSSRREPRQMREQCAAVEAEREELEQALEIEQGGALRLQAELSAAPRQRDEATREREAARLGAPESAGADEPGGGGSGRRCSLFRCFFPRRADAQGCADAE